MIVQLPQLQQNEYHMPTFSDTFDQLTVQMLTLDFHHWLLWKEIFHIRYYGFEVQLLNEYSWLQINDCQEMDG